MVKEYSHVAVTPLALALHETNRQVCIPSEVPRGKGIASHISIPVSLPPASPLRFPLWPTYALVPQRTSISLQAMPVVQHPLLDLQGLSAHVYESTPAAYLIRFTCTFMAWGPAARVHHVVR